MPSQTKRMAVLGPLSVLMAIESLATILFKDALKRCLSVAKEE